MEYLKSINWLGGISKMCLPKVTYLNADDLLKEDRKRISDGHIKIFFRNGKSIFYVLVTSPLEIIPHNYF